MRIQHVPAISPFTDMCASQRTDRKKFEREPGRKNTEIMDTAFCRMLPSGNTGYQFLEDGDDRPKRFFRRIYAAMHEAGTNKLWRVLLVFSAKKDWGSCVSCSNILHLFRTPWDLSLY